MAHYLQQLEGALFAAVRGRIIYSSQTAHYLQQLDGALFTAVRVRIMYSS